MVEQTHKIRMPLIFNEWMRRYTEEPEKFEREWESVRLFLEQDKNGTQPTYGQQCTAYFEALATELFPST